MPLADHHDVVGDVPMPEGVAAAAEGQTQGEERRSLSAGAGGAGGQSSVLPFSPPSAPAPSKRQRPEGTICFCDIVLWEENLAMRSYTSSSESRKGPLEMSAR